LASVVAITLGRATLLDSVDQARAAREDALDQVGVPLVVWPVLRTDWLERRFFVRAHPEIPRDALRRRELMACLAQAAIPDGIFYEETTRAP
jgi:hypothetical protein